MAKEAAKAAGTNVAKGVAAYTAAAAQTPLLVKAADALSVVAIIGSGSVAILA